MEHKGTVKIETDRLILRRVEPRDVEPAFRNWCSDEEVTKFLTWPTHTTKEVTEYVLNLWLAEYDKPEYYQWVIEPKDAGEAVGSIAVVNQNDDIDKIEIGYCLSRKWWRQGIMSEALSALIPFFFEEVKVNRIEARHDPNNPNSGKVLAKCGFKYEGTLRQNDRNNQGIVDACIYSLLREEWTK